MFVFPIYLIFMMTYLRAQKPDQRNLFNNGGWIPRTDLASNINSKNLKQTSNNTDKAFVPLDKHEINENIDSFTDFGKDQKNDKIVIQSRSLYSRVNIDGGGVSSSKDTLMRRNSFETQSTNIPLIETFREKFQEQEIIARKTDTNESEKSKIKFLIGAKKGHDSSTEKHQMTEKDATVVRYNDEKTEKTKQSLSSAQKSRDAGSNNSTKASALNKISDQLNLTTNSTNIVAKNSTGKVTKIDIKPQQPVLSGEKLSPPSLKTNKPLKNDTSIVSRFRKQVLNWQSRGPPRFSSVGASHRIPPTHSYSTLALQAPEPFSQKRTDFFSQRPLKLAQPYPAHSFKPGTPEYLPDRDFGLFDRQDQAGQFYPQGYLAQPLPNNSSYYNTPVVNYYYPSVSYQPTRAPQVELTTQAYPPLGVPSQTYQVPGYQYGPPDQSYGPPELPELQPIQEAKPYRPQGYFRIILNDDRCVMSRQVGAEALIDVSLLFRSQKSQLKNCALMFSSTLNIALSSMVQSDDNITTVDLVRQLNLRLFTVLPAGHISEIKSPWYMDDTSPGLTFADTGTIIITFQPSTPLNFRLLIFSYRDTIPRVPGIVTSVLVANATAPFSETTLVEIPESTTQKQDGLLPTTEKQDELLPTTEKQDELLPTTEKQDELLPTTEKQNTTSSTTEKPDAMVSSTPEQEFLEML
nr:PREDICTED: uncharacterized protein LOC109038102 [Bemisia tabaci]